MTRLPVALAWVAILAAGSACGDLQVYVDENHVEGVILVTTIAGR